MYKPLYQARAGLFKGLGHPVRIRLLGVRAESEHGVAGLRARVHAPAASLSRLAVLGREGQVRTHRDATGICYALATPQGGNLLAVARGILGAVPAERVGLLADLRRAPDALWSFARPRPATVASTSAASLTTAKR